MKKKKMRLTAILLTVFLLFGSVVPIYAAKNVTKTYKAPVTKMLRKLDSYLGYCCGERTSFKYDVYARTTMAYFMNSVIGKSLAEAKRISAADMKLYFGTSKTKLKKFAGFGIPKNPSYLLRNRNGKIVYTGGDWGDCGPRGIVKKIVKTASKTYVVTYNVYLYSVYEQAYVKYAGTYKIYLKKVRNRNGFIIMNMKQTRSNHIHL